MVSPLGKILCLFQALCIYFVDSSQWYQKQPRTHAFLAKDTVFRGGGGTARVSKSDGRGKVDTHDEDTEHVFALLARAVRNRWNAGDTTSSDSKRKNDSSSKSSTSSTSSPPSIPDLVKAFESLSQAQRTFKGLDGVAHEAYQRTHKHEGVKVEVSGRASRVVARTSVVASALGACELCELVLYPSICLLQDGTGNTSDDGTLANREVVFNETMKVDASGDCPSFSLSVLVLYEPSYRGGSGVNYGDVQEMMDRSNSSSTKMNKRNQIQGRLLIAIGVPQSSSLSSDAQVVEDAFDLLSQPPSHVRLKQGRSSSATMEAASVQPSLHAASSVMLERIESVLRQYNQSAIHMVGYSLGGGVACIAATILDGRLPLKKSVSKKQQQTRNRKKTKKSKASGSSIEKEEVEVKKEENQTVPVLPLQGLGRSRTSAVAIGAPPSISSNVQTDFIVSILHGDDFVGRATSESLDRFLERTRKALHKGFLSSRLNRMSDTLSLATSNLKSYAHGSEGEEARLSVPGQAYLVRPRRLGGVCSIHEFGNQLKGGREAIRASVLWQLNEILLSKSMWKHHQLEAYIQSLDLVRIRGLEDSEDDVDGDDED